MALTRKKITVRGKRKTYQRTVMVKATPTPMKRSPLRPQPVKPSAPRGRSLVPIKSSLRQSNGGQVGFTQFMRQHGKAWAGHNLAQGALSGVSGYAGARLGENRASKKGANAAGRDRGAGMGAALGLTGGQIGYAAATRNMRSVRGMERGLQNLSTAGRLGVGAVGLATNIAGTVAGAVGTHHVWRAAETRRKRR